MVTSTVVKRYARAFFDVTGEEKRYEAYYQELNRFSALMEENKNLKEFLSNPVFKKADKKNVVNKVLSKLNLSATTTNFLKLLTDKRRIGSIAGIEENYRKLMDNAIGICRVQVKTAFPLTTDLTVNLQQALESLTARKVEMQIEVDASMLGGIVVRVGDRLYDGSIKTQLENMKKLLGDVHVESR